jgi:hypothetical protein
LSGIFAGRLLSQVSDYDPLACLGTTNVLGLCGGGRIHPARWAASIDPMRALSE